MSNDDTMRPSSETQSPDHGSRTSGPGSPFTPSDPFDPSDTVAPDPTDDLSAEALEAIAEARQRIAQTPASVVVANHAMGLFELAAIHLSDEPPRLVEAQLAIDALGLLVEGLGARIGEHHDTLVSALSNIRLVYVQRTQTDNVQRTQADNVQRTQADN